MRKILLISLIILYVCGCKKEEIDPVNYRIETIAAISGYPVTVYKNNLILTATNRYGYQNFSYYNGSDVKEIISSTVYGNMVVYKEFFYFTYDNTLVKFDGSSTTFIQCPDSTFRLSRVIAEYKDKLYLSYLNNGEKLAEFDGDSIIFIASPGVEALKIDYPVIYNDYLFFRYLTKDHKYYFSKFDGSSISFVSDGNEMFEGSFIYNSNIFFKVYKNNKTCLGKLDGSIITIVSNPDDGLGFQGSAVVFGNNLYFRYLNVNGVYQLAKYDGNKISLVANPTGDHYGVWDSPIVYDGHLFFQYNSGNDAFQLAVYDGTSIRLVENPGSSLQFKGHPVIWKNELYFQYGDQLAKLVKE